MMTSFLFQRYVDESSLDKAQFDEAIYYLKAFGSHLTMVQFYRRHGYLMKATQYILDHVSLHKCLFTLSLFHISALLVRQNCPGGLVLLLPSIFVNIYQPQHLYYLHARFQKYWHTVDDLETTDTDLQFLKKSVILNRSS